MEKDRDISKTIYTPRRVSLAGSAVLAGAAFVAACGGGSSKSASTSEGGAVSNPTTGSTLEIKTAVPSATAVVEVPTATATVAKTEILSPQELISVGTEVSGIFEEGFQGLDVSAISYGDIPQPVERDLKSIQNAISVCTGAVPFPYRDDAEKQRSEQDPTLLITGLSNFCELAGEASSRLYTATGREQFKQANMLMEKIHYSMLNNFSQKYPSVPYKDSFWQMQKGRFYPFGATGTSK